MNLQSRKIEFIEQFLKIESEDVIFRLEKLLKKSNTLSLQDNFNPMSMEDFNQRIDDSLEDSKNGRIIEGIDFKSQMEKWN